MTEQPGHFGEKIGELFTATDHARSLAALLRGYFEHDAAGGVNCGFNLSSEECEALALVADMIYRNAHDAYNITADLSEMGVSVEAAEKRR